MIKKLIRKLIGDKNNSAVNRRRIARAEHGVKEELISPCAIRIVKTLQRSGFEAYIVGGAVRDLLLGREPKDFDVVTDATPEEVRALFRQSRIIGRRFRLVHVRCGRELVEVSTYRAPHQNGEGTQDRKGRLVRDNTFGTIDDDAIRRDFTVNALFYDPISGDILDFCEGYEDVHQRTLRMIGSPTQRYREDPVRMLRAIRLSEKLELTIDSKTRVPFKRLANLLDDVPTARLYDEFLKILKSGASLRSVEQLVRFGFHQSIFPKMSAVVDKGADGEFLRLVFRRTDERINGGKTVSPAFLFAAVFWPDVREAWGFSEDEKKPMGKLARAVNVVTDHMAKTFVPKRLIGDIREIWMLQGRMLFRRGKRPLGVLGHPRFRAGYDFLELRGIVGEIDPQLVEWWEQFQTLNPIERDDWVLKESGGPSGPRKKRKRYRSRRRPDA